MPLRLLLFLLLLAPSLQAQLPTDSLRQQLARLEQRRPGFARDTSRVRLLCRLAGQTKDWQAASNHWEQAIKLAEKLNWAPGRLEAYRGMGRHYRSKGSHMEATYYYHKGLHLAEKTGDLHYQGDCYRFLGVAYSQAGDLPRSLAALNKAVRLARKSGNRRQYFLSVNDIGNAHYRAKNYIQALHFYQRCIDENQPVDSTLQCFFWINVADIYQLLNRLETSRKTYEEVFRYGKYLPDQDSAMTYARFAMLQFKLGNPTTALSYSRRAEQIAPRIKGFYTLSLVSQALSEAQAANGNWREALTHERQYRVYRDSILSQTQQQRLDGIKVGYENEKLNERMEVKEQSNRLLWGGIALLIVFGGTLFGANRLLLRRRKEIERQRDKIVELNNSLERRVDERTAELQQANEELVRKNQEIGEALFKGQTLERKRVASELHDNLGGTLMAIRWRVESLQVEGLNEIERQIYNDLYGMINRAYGEVRLLSHHLMPAILEKEGLETALHELAVPINKSKRLRLSVETEEGINAYLDTRQQLELYSVALELVTNIMKHAQATEAQLWLGREDQQLLLKVTDNGIGMLVDREAPGVGLRNIQTRLDVISGRWEVISAPGEGTTVLIRLSLSVP
ncbi:MAG: tetratricopeptide repeat protein [Cytophagaceae bacterium]|nr:tetratricopeptide repeat protein [Cytophagaceae bacterium]